MQNDFLAEDMHKIDVLVHWNLQEYCMGSRRNSQGLSQLSGNLSEYSDNITKARQFRNLPEKTILLIDNNGADVSNLVSQLKKLDFNIEVANTFGEAEIILKRTLAEGERFDAIIVKLMMPGTSGFQAASLIKVLE